METFCYLGDTVGAGGGAVDSVIGWIRNGQSNFRDLVPFLSSRGLPLGAKVKGRLFPMCTKLYGI